MIVMTETTVEQVGMFSLNVDVQNALVNESDCLPEEQFTLWANLAYAQVRSLNSDVAQSDELDVTIRVVDESEIT